MKKKKGKGVKEPEEEISLPPPAPPTFSVFIVEGYTPQTDLSTVKLLIEKLIQSSYIRRADVLVDDLVLPAMPLGDERPPESVIGKLARFVLRVEVAPLDAASPKSEVPSPKSQVPGPTSESPKSQVEQANGQTDKLANSEGGLP